MRCACSLSRPTMTWLSAACLTLAFFATSCKRQPATTEEESVLAAKEPATGTDTSLASVSVTASEMPSAGLIAQDADDDSGSPACLPHSDTVAGWIKTGAVRIESSEEHLLRLPDSGTVDQMRPYGIVEVATCTYEKQAGDRRWHLVVELLRCNSSAEAYGLCSTQHQGTNLGRAHRIWVDRKNNDFLLHAWRSDYYLRFTAGPAGDEALLSQAEQFIGRILLALPKADPPPLVRTLPTEARPADRTWFAPTCLPLTAPGARVLTTQHATALDDLLGTSRACGLAVAAYQSDPADPPNIVWLIEYPAPADARSAYARYKNLLDRQAGSATQTPSVPDALLLSPVGRFLAGSWSPEEESLMHVLPLLRATLPRLAGQPE